MTYLKQRPTYVEPNPLRSYGDRERAIGRPFEHLEHLRQLIGGGDGAVLGVFAFDGVHHHSRIYKGAMAQDLWAWGLENFVEGINGKRLVHAGCLSLRKDSYSEEYRNSAKRRMRK